MDFLEYLIPVESSLQHFANSQLKTNLGSIVKFHLEENLSEKPKIYLLGIHSVDESSEHMFFEIRKELYSLAKGSWDFNLLDLGNLSEGASMEDTATALKLINSILDDHDVFITLSESKNFIIPDVLSCAKDHLNITCIDEKIRIQPDLELTDDSILGYLLSHYTHKVDQLTCLAYQSHFAAPETMDLMEHLSFNWKRLAEVQAQIKQLEPNFRLADSTYFHLSAMQGNLFHSVDKPSPNGLSSQEMASLIRLAGSSPQAKRISLLDYKEKENALDHQLVAQLIWYALEGISIRQELPDFENIELFEKYYVEGNKQTYEFFKEKKNFRWWIKFKEGTDNLTLNFIPCTIKDYKEALEDGVPDSLWRRIKSFY